MIVVRDLRSTLQISSTEIRKLALQRINDLGVDAIDAALAFLLIIELGDDLEALSTQMGFDPLKIRMAGIRFGEPGFTPSFEFVAEFPDCYDMVFVISDDGYGIEVFIPKHPGVNADLLGCATSTPSQPVKPASHE